MQKRKRPGSALDRMVGEHIRVMRRNARMSRQRLAAAIGVATARIVDYEIGGKHVGARRLCLIARALHCPVSCFFTVREDAFSQRQKPRRGPGKQVQARAWALTRAYYLIGAYRLRNTARSHF